MSFPDHFSGVAGQCAASRPRNPDALFASLAANAPARALTRAQFIAYLRTWSAVKEYASRGGRDAVQLLRPGLECAWPETAGKLVRWPLTLLVGRKPPERSK